MLGSAEYGSREAITSNSSYKACRKPFRQNRLDGMTSRNCGLAAEYCSKRRQQCQILGFLGEEFLKHLRGWNFGGWLKCKVSIICVLQYTFFGVALSFEKFVTSEPCSNIKKSNMAYWYHISKCLHDHDFLCLNLINCKWVWEELLVILIYPWKTVLRYSNTSCSIFLL